MPLTEYQSKVGNSDKRFRVLITGRRFGKTHLAIRELSKFASQPKKICWYVAPTYRQSKTIVWNDLKEKLFSIRWIKNTNESELSLTLKNNSIICLKGADNPDSLRGSGIDFLVMDEFADIKDSAWYEVLRPTLSDREGHAFFCGTPRGMGNWAYDLYIKGQSGEKDWGSWKFKTIQGHQVTAEEIKQVRQDLDERTFAQEFLGSFVTYSGQVYYNFNREENVKNVRKNEGVIHIGMDFNISPMTAVCFQTDGETIKIFDEIVMYSSNTDEMVKEIHDRYSDKRIIVYPDPASRQRKTSAGGRTDLSILINAGFNVKVKPRHPEVRDRINAVNSRLKTTEGKRLLFVNSKCKNTINSLERLLYKEGTSVPEKNSGLDHISDALGYAIDWLYPVRTIYKPTEQRRWS